MTEPITTPAPPATASPGDVRRWRQYLADERAEAAVYRDLATHRSGEEREILLALADAEGRHEAHWLALLGDRAGRPRRPDLRTRVLGFLARRFGSVFVLALAQRAEARSPYDADDDATAAMAADERIHEEVVRGLAARGRNRLSGTFRAAVFGANDGLVSNLSLVLGVSASGVATSYVLLTGLAGLLAGALSMGAGEYVSVRSQRELLEASTPDPQARTALPHLDLDANELALVYRARGMAPEEAEAHAAEVLGGPEPDVADAPPVADVRRRRRARGHRHRAGRGPVQLLLLRLRRRDPRAALSLRAQRAHRRRGRGGAGRADAARHGRRRRPAVGRLPAAPGPAPAGHRVRGRRRHLPAGPAAGYRRGLSAPAFGRGRLGTRRCPMDEPDQVRVLRRLARMAAGTAVDRPLPLRLCLACVTILDVQGGAITLAYDEPRPDDALRHRRGRGPGLRTCRRSSVRVRATSPGVRAGR